MSYAKTSLMSLGPLFLGLSACLAQKEVTANVPSETFQVVKQPSQIYRPGERIKILGTDLSSGLRIFIAGASYSIDFSSAQEISFVLPTNVPLLSAAGTKTGKLEVDLKNDNRAVALEHVYLAEDKNFPLVSGDSSWVCDTQQFYNAKGVLGRGTKKCTPPKDCTLDGEKGCMTNADFTAATVTDLALKVVVGKTVGGVVGKVAISHPNCAAAGEQNCVATGTFFAGTTCSGDGSACFLPSYVVTKQPLKAISYDAISAGLPSIRSSFAIGGLTGSLSDCSANNAQGCVTTSTYKSADLANLVDTNIKSGVSIAGVSGAVIPTPLNCTASGQQSCVAVGLYKSADLTNLSATNIRLGVTIASVTGSVIETPANCAAAGAQSCVATGTYYAGSICSANSSACYLPSYVTSAQPLRAISYDAINASLAAIRSSTTLAGLSGSLVDCNTSNALGCVTAGTYKSADWTNLVAANIKSGASVAGLTGTYPSASNLLSGASSVADLDYATFDAKIKSAISFEWFGPDGSAYSNSGDPDISSSNILSGVTTFGTTGTIVVSCLTTVQATCQADSACIWSTGACSIDPWNIRHGVSLSGNTGALKTNCKNRANSTYFNVDTMPPGNVIVTTGTTNDWWDTLEDHNNNLAYPTTVVSGFTAASDCTYTNWADITADGACDTNGDNCMMKDLITGLIWSESHPVLAAAPAVTALTWSAAVAHCDALNYGGRIDWRLPTQKEMLLAYVHGIRAVGYNGTGTIRAAGSTDNNNSFNLNVDSLFWSATSMSTGALSAFRVPLNTGLAIAAVKTTTNPTICVAP